MRRPPTGLLVALGLYVALRAAVLYLSFDQVAMTNYELYPMGTLPKAMLIGAKFPLQAYYDNAAGQLAIGFLALPLYLLFGSGWTSLKLVPALCGVGALLCVWSLLDRFVSRRAATLGALAFALGPSEFVLKYSLMASGNHFENLFFSSLAVWSFYKLHSDPKSRYGRNLLLAGFCSGLALFIFLGAIIPVGIALGMHLGLRGWRGTGRDLGRALVGFAVGIAPLVYLNLFSGARGVAFLESSFGSKPGAGKSLGTILRRMGDFLGRDLPHAGFHQGFSSPHPTLPNALTVALFALAWLVILPRALAGLVGLVRALFAGGARPSLSELAPTPLLLLPPLSALAFGLSSLRIDADWPLRLGVAGYRYFLPMFLVGMLTVMVVADRAMARGGVARIGGMLMAGLLLASSLWNLAWIGSGTAGVGAHYRGWNFVQAARGLFNSSIALDGEQRLAIAGTLPPFYRARLYRGMGMNESMRWVVKTAGGRGVKDFDLVREGSFPLAETLERYPERARPEVARGMGAGLRYYVGMRGQSDANLTLLVECFQKLAAREGEWAQLAIEGAAQSRDFPLTWSEVPRILPRSRRLLELLPSELRPAYARGLGEVVGRLFARGIPAEQEFLTAFLHGTFALGGEELLAGLGRGVAADLEEGELPSELRAAVPDDGLWERVRAGFEEERGALR